MENIYIYTAVSVFLLVASLIILRNIFYKERKKSNDIKKL